ncbi:MAG: Transcriptional regulator, IclR [Solirubrobacterales bacterium]|jgi:IclR family KDG regulon transcriptional repressor|nr:Transcriptional regulator, IclR [Solirubrobacterales bacterium]
MPRRMLSTVQNAGRVLDLFSREQAEWGVSEIGRALGIPKSNAHALAASLAEIGMLTRTSRGRYRLGWHLLTLTDRMRVNFAVRDHALEIMRALVKRTGETVLLAVLDRSDVLYIERAEGTHPIVRLVGVQVGAKLPAYCTAVGKILLSDHTPEEVREIVGEGPFRARTNKTTTTIEELEGALEKVRGEGVAYDLGEIVPDACCVAAPICGDDFAIVAALGISVPAYRFSAHLPRLRAMLREASHEISAALSEDSAPDRDASVAQPA